MANGLRVVLLPGVFLYAVFVADFGEKEHVFMPPRRWLERQKAAFFTLTPAEQELTGTEQQAVPEEKASDSEAKTKP
ncbi:hypothetical protein EW146_g4698 [Bondarzewia mesenterica]|uniref:Uncharacterized protein n=1 Tax=Bondarzewia mesenterica TaxID=1095465 RepID=A0A4S4LTS5_9AGAM|nr:hypothetical protein EW146_g4698 [Bondarzewia mesenterica]